MIFDEQLAAELRQAALRYPVLYSLAMNKPVTIIRWGFCVFLLHLYSLTVVGQANYFHRWDYVFSGVSFTGGAAVSYPVTGNTANLAIGWRTQIADSTGATVLFKAPVQGFGQGRQVLTAVNQRMPNGTLVASYADALLVPRPNHPENYYFVSVQASATSPLLYSIIDTRLNGRQGDFVVGGSRLDSLNQVLHPQAIQGLMLARHANRRDVWVLSATGTGFRCYRVTPAGIQRTGISSPFRDNAISDAASIKLTSRGTELLVTRTVAGASNQEAYVEIYQFDPATGQVARGRLVQLQRNNPFASNTLTPSPNGRYVYDVLDSLRGTRPTSQIVQYDMTAPDTLAFRRSRRLVYWSDTTATGEAWTAFAPFRAGPDGRLYMLSNRGGVDSLSVIERPDAPAAQCRFRRSTLRLVNSINGANDVDRLEHIPTGFNFLAGFRVVSACQGAPVTLTLDNAPYLDSARWRFGDGTSTASLGPLQHRYAQAGTYRVRVQVYYGGYSTDTLSQVVTIFPAPTVRLPADTASCGGQALVLTPRGLSAGITGYRWNTGATTPTLRVTQAGTYILTVTTATGCQAVATAQVRLATPPTVRLPADSLLCAQGAPRLLRPVAVSADVVAYRWQDGSTQPTFQATQPGTYTLTVANAAGCTATASIVLAAPVAPALLLGPDTTICRGTPVRLRVHATSPVVAIRWPDGSTGATFLVAESGTYRATVTLAGGCVYEGQVRVTAAECPAQFTIPSIITPNGDHYNDAFVVPGLAPGQWRLEVYNRWGQPVYDQAGYVNGAWGGDGLGAGVYFYRLSRTGYQFKGWVEIVR